MDDQTSLKLQQAQLQLLGLYTLNWQQRTLPPPVVTSIQDFNFTISSCQHSVNDSTFQLFQTTVLPRYNEPRYYELPLITNRGFGSQIFHLTYIPAV